VNWGLQISMGGVDKNVGVKSLGKFVFPLLWAIRPEVICWVPVL
jgi:hypothetical protein